MGEKSWQQQFWELLPTWEVCSGTDTGREYWTASSVSWFLRKKIPSAKSGDATDTMLALLWYWERKRVWFTLQGASLTIGWRVGEFPGDVDQNILDELAEKSAFRQFYLNKDTYNTPDLFDFETWVPIWLPDYYKETYFDVWQYVKAIIIPASAYGIDPAKGFFRESFTQKRHWILPEHFALRTKDRDKANAICQNRNQYNRPS